MLRDQWNHSLLLTDYPSYRITYILTTSNLLCYIINNRILALIFHMRASKRDHREPFDSFPMAPCHSITGLPTQGRQHAMSLFSRQPQEEPTSNLGELGDEYDVYPVEDLLLHTPDHPVMISPAGARAGNRAGTGRQHRCPRHQGPLLPGGGVCQESTAFTGGQDARSFRAVSAQDIGGARA